MRITRSRSHFRRSAVDEPALARDWCSAVDELLLDRYPRASWRRPDAA